MRLEYPTSPGNTSGLETVRKSSVPTPPTVHQVFLVDQESIQPSAQNQGIPERHYYRSHLLSAQVETKMDDADEKELKALKSELAAQEASIRKMKRMLETSAGSSTKKGKSKKKAPSAGKKAKA